MSKFFAVTMWIVLGLTSGWAQSGHSISITSDGWTVVAMVEQSTLAIRHDKLGTVLRDVRLNLKNESGLRQLKNWTAETQGRHQLSIQTREPSTRWLVDLGPNTMKISSTSGPAILTAIAPVSSDRIVARLLDPEGVQVDWEGTREVADGYGGKQTQNKSFLPKRNPECMYFGLGAVSSLNLHSLFDRKSDTAIAFSEKAQIRRNSQDPDLLEITIPLPVKTIVHIIPDYYTQVLGLPYYVPFDDSHFRQAPVIWNSWDNYYDEVTEKDIVENANWIAGNLKDYGFQYVVLDDGYDRGENGVHYWIKNWNKKKFPHGPAWLTNYIRSKGLRPGLWLVPNSYAGAVSQHPEWYLRYKNGKVVLDYSTPALDSSNPRVLNFLEQEFSILDKWGFDYYKFDGEYSIPQYVPSIDKGKLYNQSIDPLVAYRRRIGIIRKTLGPGRFIEGCPSGTPLNGIGYFDSYFNGDDMYPSWQGSYALFSSINDNAFLNHIVIYVMPGEGIEVGPRMTVEEAAKKRVPSVVAVARTREDPLNGFGTTSAEARTLVTFLALTGVPYSVSSVMPELPPERVQLLRMTLPTLPILPIDLFSRGSNMRWDLFKHTTLDDYAHNYPRILDLKVNAKSGIYDVVGMTNWGSQSSTRELSFKDQLGLDPALSYIVFDFWNQKLYGVFNNRLTATVKPHDTRVFLIHPDLHRPELIGTSRHITGAYSITSLDWDGSRNILSGSSRTVPGKDYTLWIYVPDGAEPYQMLAEVEGRPRIPVHYEFLSNTLKASFSGQQGTVNWEIKFRIHGAK